jgi:cyanobactin maturation PatA/PatG family protease
MQVREIPGLRAVWEETRGEPSVCVAVLDGPVDLKHPCFDGASIAPLETLVCNTPDSGPASQHGTHVASMLFGRHDSPAAGIVPGCRGLIVPVFASGPNGQVIPCSQVDLARAILQAAQAGAKVINVSGGQYSASGEAYPLLADAVKFCADNGVLIVSAAGNDGCECLHIPSALPSVLAVGAMDEEGSPLSFSNWGGKYQEQGILAPGEGIIGATPGGGTAALGGTSIAAAIVSGVAALLMSMQVRRGKHPDPKAVRRAILASAEGCAPDDVAPGCRRLLAGRLNVSGAVALLMAEVGNDFVPVSDSLPAVRVQAVLPSSRELEVAEAAIVTPEVDQVSMSGEATKRDAPSVPMEAQVNPSSEVAPSSELKKTVEQVMGVCPSAGCACGGNGNGAAKQIVFVLGQIGYDFGTEARRDSFTQSMQPPSSGVQPNPHDPVQLLAYLEENSWDAASVIWTLSLDATPIYAVLPLGAFAGDAYQKLRQFLGERITEGVERVSIPGIIVGQLRLLNGQSVPVIQPEIRGMFSWTTKALVEAVAGTPPPATAPREEQTAHAEKAEGVDDFLDRVYFELRNLGLTSQERAINFAATNAFHLEGIYESAMKEDMDLDTIEVERSAICRPDSDCWDVKLLFFFPERQVQTVRKVYRFTVDVSDIVPVTVGPHRSWYVR